MTRPSFQVYTKLDLEYPTESNDKNHIHTAEKSKTTGDVCSTISPAGAIREVFPNQRACCAILQSPAEHMARIFLYSFTPPSSKKKNFYCSYLIMNKHWDALFIVHQSGRLNLCLQRYARQVCRTITVPMISPQDRAISQLRHCVASLSIHLAEVSAICRSLCNPHKPQAAENSIYSGRYLGWANIYFSGLQRVAICMLLSACS